MCSLRSARGMTREPATVTSRWNEIMSAEDQLRVLALKEEQCSHSLQQMAPNTDNVSSCAAVWDGMLCWNQTMADYLAAQPCPAYIVGVSLEGEATKLCQPDGQWYHHPTYNHPWTNYSQCFPGSTATVFSNFSESSGNYSYIMHYLPVMKTISQVGYSVSLVALVGAFIILSSVKKLRCPRNTLHMHLFVSFILRAFMALLKDTLFVHGVGLPADTLYKDGSSYFVNPLEQNWECKVVTSLWQFFIMANYSWILMEGLYLHNLIFLALFSDSSAITLYVVLGWGLPVIFVLPWVIIRIVLEDTFCWTTNKNPLFFLIIRVSTGAFILINFVLFINIVRVLLLKLKASVCKETRTYRRWAKSTLVLVPLFGVHYTLFLGMSYSIGVDQTVELVWLFCDQLFASFQGFFVAVLYCFMNGEVLAELRKKWSRLEFPRRRPRPRRTVTFNGRGNGNGSCPTSASFTSLTVPRFPSSRFTANKRAASLMQATDNSQISCLSNVGDLGIGPNMDQGLPTPVELRLLRPH